ncbi:phosphotransferase [Phlyctema vagabunda]|uniref:Phosphotransferase n=1 Tax=Phlyctema vagabunda TaxID=108571 RepID=A0ABR4PPR9_9HELO
MISRATQIQASPIEYVEGDRLDKVWNALAEPEKLKIANQLRAMLAQLRGPKGEYVGAPNRGRVVDRRRLDLYGGPFDTESDFNQFLPSDFVPKAPRILRDIASQSLSTGHEIVFTHGDFDPRNILVRGGRVVAILD